jgi:hypothetical protein
MDPLTALSVAGTIIQFVDFGTKLLKSSVQLYKSNQGTLKAHEELKLITGDLHVVISKIRGSQCVTPGNSVPPIAGDEGIQGSFVKICDETAEIAAELLKKLNGIRVKDGKDRAWESVKAAVKAAWSKDEIQSLEKRLRLLKESLQFDLLDLLRFGLLYRRAPRTSR